MKEFYTKTLLTTLLLLCSSSVATAEDFEKGFIAYNITDATAKTVAVTRNLYNEYIGTVTIPATVTYNGITYRVTAIENSAFYYCDELNGVT